MKILQIIHKPQNRGAETFACQLSYHLNNLGHEVKIVAIYNGAAQLPYLPKIVSLNASTTKKVVDIPAWRKLSKLIKEFNPDIIQANSGDTLKYVVLSKCFFKWKIPIVSRNASEVGRYLKSFFSIELNRFLYKKVDKVISVSQVSKKDIIDHFPFLLERTEVIPVGLEMNKIVHNIPLHPKAKKHVVHVGGFSYEKNHLGLLNIFELVLQVEPSVHLHLIGDGPLKNLVLEEVQKRKLTQAITFYGFIPEPLPYIKSADILVLPSIIEGLPGVILEAMYCKTPVVAYDVGGIREIVNYGTGSLIEKADEKAFADEVVKILRKPDEWIVANAYQNAITNFVNEGIALNFVNSYEEIING